MPFGQYAPTYLYLMARTTATPESLVPAVEEAIWKGDPSQPLVDPMAVTTLAAAGAVLLPAIAAGRIDPMRVLREE